MRLRCYLRLLNMVNFLNFATLRPDISKTGGHTKKIIYTQNLLKVVRNLLDPKEIQNSFSTTRHKNFPSGTKLP